MLGGYLSAAKCRRAHCPAESISTHCLLSSKIQIGFTFMVLATQVVPNKEPFKWELILKGGKLYMLLWMQICILLLVGSTLAYYHSQGV